MSVVAETEQAVTSGGDVPDLRASSAHRVLRGIIIFRATPLQVGLSSIEVTLQVSIVGARSISS
jgi:hypothetical protein